MESKPVTIRQIAKAAGVSPSTVFRVLNSDTPVSPTTRAKVIAAQQILQSKKNTAPVESMGRFSIGIIMPAHSAADLGGHPSLFDIITSFVEVLSARGFSNSTIIYDEETMTPQSLLSTPMDGYLIIGTSEEQERAIVPFLTSAGLPNILLNRQSEDVYTSSVNVDDISSTADATEYLISLGHRDIAFIGGNKNFQNTRHRLLGYKLAMEKHGLPVRSEYILFGEFSEQSGYQQGKALLNLHHRPTAGICASDPLAIGCMRCLTDNGLRLPEEFATIGFGNIEASKYVTPSLSTISQPSKEMGAIAANTLIQMLENPIICFQKVRLKTSLVIRDSTGSPISGR